MRQKGLKSNRIFSEGDFSPRKDDRPGKEKRKSTLFGIVIIITWLVAGYFFLEGQRKEVREKEKGYSTFDDSEAIELDQPLLWRTVN